ncbi:efflux ABC transporter, permease protein [Marvinbryantia formatexigens DSM 14469]|uniref:Efflux ABC transporter, permease protein n=1 Tax=Marvinbryantia formatexigens DSM 14469 TaxID=478749 RepID=C6L9H0_9FIRM|nr:ABC transporter permease [Marvinbryantia formatexigens]EET62909.1 efflux ABC transporter, permease protein [Marvinbryantia formatexigens DSM 14469]UWO23502.1 ABC transporter permease [Marvinbryantia formatexigens DSM 14469]SDG56138.1 putative ABC transport system permease protein [Marvinbryantia formatexigens]
MTENIRLSFQGIWSHKLRSLLTMLGIIIGIAAIISIVSTIKGTNEEIKNNLIGAGDNTVLIQMEQNGFPLSIFSESDIPTGVREVSAACIEKLRACSGVKNVTCYTERQSPGNVFYKNKALSDIGIRGIDREYFNTGNYYMRSGRNFDTKDYENFRKVIILEQQVAEMLFQNRSPIGEVLEIGGAPFTIIGVVGKVRRVEPKINSVDDYLNYVTDSPGYIFMPKASWPIAFFYDEPENVIVKAERVEDMESVGKEAEKILNAALSPEQTEVQYKADDILKKVEDLQSLGAATQKQLIWIASISLLVGGIGVMNIMLVSVTERTSEIGLKKAIGARKQSILLQFLTEAAVLTSIGGAIGVLCGIAMAQIISRISGVAVAVSIPAAGIAVVFSMVIGIVFGLLPSVKAANLNPIDALRRE